MSGFGAEIPRGWRKLATGATVKVGDRLDSCGQWVWITPLSCPFTWKRPVGSDEIIIRKIAKKKSRKKNK